METTILEIPLEKELKRKADGVFTSAGFDTATAVRIFLKQSVIRHRLPFEVVGEEEGIQTLEENSEASQAEIRRRIADCEAGKNMTAHELIEDDDA
jgi:DNA-damage-inducible protein J